MVSALVVSQNWWTVLPAVNRARIQASESCTAHVMQRPSGDMPVTQARPASPAGGTRAPATAACNPPPVGRCRGIHTRTVPAFRVSGGGHNTNAQSETGHMDTWRSAEGANAYVSLTSGSINQSSDRMVRCPAVHHACSINQSMSSGVLVAQHL